MIKTLHKKRNDHIIKIDIRNIEIPKKVEPPVIKKIVKAEALVPKQVRVKPSIPTPIKPKPKKVEKKKRVIKKKVVKKKPIKKRVIKKAQVKKPIKKTIVKKTPMVETYTAPPPVEEELIYIEEPLLTESFEVIDEPMASQKSVASSNDDLSSFLSTPTPMVSSGSSYPSSKIKKLYGSSFHSFTPTQKRFIEDNLETIQQITQSTLTRRGYPEGAGRTHQEGTNVVSFNLHPNGNISNLRLKQRIGYRALDDNTLELIRTAYKDYPYPSTTTKIVFYVTYSIYGY